MGLPREVLIKRINVELKVCSTYLKIEIPQVMDDRPFPIEITLNLRNIPAYVLNGDDIEHIEDHTMIVTIDEEFGFKKPKIRWNTPIFHPNIMMPSDGGHVCLNTLDKWEFSYHLIDVIQGVEQLIMHPNPQSPLGTDSCMKASEYLNNESKFEVSVKYGGR